MSFYFTGVPCLRGHVGPRYIRSRQCVACAADRSKAWYSDPANAAKNAEKNKLWWSLHKDSGRSREWRSKNPERVRRVLRAWREKNAERFKKNQAEWWKANKTKKSVYFNAYRARKRNNGGSHTTEDVEKLLSAQRGRCVACRSRLIKYHVDHIIALKNGGSNDRQNLQILCPSCNSTKSARCPVEFMQSKGWLL